MTRLRCSRCERPQVDCLCRWIRPVDNPVPVLVLQHRLEVHQAKGSARLLQLSLAHCRVVVGPPWDAGVLANPAGRPSLLLYPATPGERVAAPPADTGHQLVVLDATWRKSRRMLFEHPWLRALPRLALQAPPPSRYTTLRRAERPGQRSTLEATCLALAQLEGDAARYAALLQAFDGFVEQQRQWRPAPLT
jgi:DTW domain-containing protein YfiP